MNRIRHLKKECFVSVEEASGQPISDFVRCRLKKSKGLVFVLSNVVDGVFRSVASRYDMMNDAMSWGIHRCWKNRLIQRLDPQADTFLLDAAGGTGDIAFRFIRETSRKYAQPTARVLVVDLNEAMLQVGKERVSVLASEDKSRMEWMSGNAERLELPDSTFDAYTIAFGIRNCTHIKAVISEAFRVLKPGGVFLCLEFSKPDSMIAPLYDLYSFLVIPRLGGVLTGDRQAYEYFVESIRRFPLRNDFLSMIRDVGFQHVNHEDLSFGIATIYSGIKIK